jgi:predicted permease
MHGHTNDSIVDRTLYPALVQVFAIIICGYMSAYFRLLDQVHLNGLNIFLSRFSLPALIFQSLCTVRFQSVKWLFLLSILISKSFIFLLAFVICFVLVRPVNFGLCGIYSIFLSQSNDFALGYPIIRSLYSTDYLEYVYLIAPISLCILNPIGFLMLEIDHSLKSNKKNYSKFYMTSKILYGTIKNPIVFMTILGICFNFLFAQQVPYLLQAFVESLANAFNSISLFYLGTYTSGSLSLLVLFFSEIFDYRQKSLSGLSIGPFDLYPN